MCIVKTESTQTEGTEIQLIKERITAGITNTDKAVSEQGAQAFREIPLGSWQHERRGLDVRGGGRDPPQAASEGRTSCGGLN